MKCIRTKQIHDYNNNNNNIIINNNNSNNNNNNNNRAYTPLSERLTIVWFM